MLGMVDFFTILNEILINPYLLLEAIMEQDAFQLLSNLNNFKNFNSEQLKSFIDSGEVVHYKKDDVIIHQGDESDHVFLLISGFLLAEVDYDTSSPVTIGAIYAGEIFGEIAYLEGTKRACSIVTHCDSLVLAFDSNAFENQVESNLILNKLINKSLIERLRRANDNKINSLPNKAIYLTYLSNPNIYQWLLDLLQQQMDKQAIKYLTITDKTLLNKFGENIGTLYFNNWIRELHRVQGSHYLVKDLVHPWTKSTRQRAKCFCPDRPASGTLR